MSNKRISGDKIQLIMIFAIPIVGVILMTGYYFYVTSQNIATGTHNYGALVQPPKQTLELTLFEQSMEAKFANYDEKWAFVVINQGECEEECQRKLYLTRQIREALGKYSHRIQNVYLQLGAVSPDTSDLLQSNYSQHRIFLVEGDEFASWSSKDEPLLEVNSADFYVVDPRGWLMMFYVKDNSYKEVIKDMKFLLKNS